MIADDLFTIDPNFDSLLPSALPNEVTPHDYDPSVILNAQNSPTSPNDWIAYTLTPTPRSGRTMRLRGRIEADSISTEQSAANKADFGNLGTSGGLRRARIGVEGNLTPDSRYLAEIDLASGQVVVRDLFVALGQVTDGGEFKFGHQREPFSLEGATSSNTFAFMERSAVNSLDPARNWGIALAQCAHSQRSTFSIGVFKSGIDSNDFQWGSGSDSAVSAKWTALPWSKPDRQELWHVGFATSSRVPDNQLVTVRQGPRSPLLELSDSTESPFVPKLQIPATFEQLFNAQTAYTRGPYWTQAEWYGTAIDQLGGPWIFYQGGYLATGYFLTGESRNYQKKSGILGTVTVARPMISEFSSQNRANPKGYGAFEFTGRLSYLDFSDPKTQTVAQTPFVGTKLPELTIGLNWYLADRLRIMFNYDYAAPYQSTTGSSSVHVLATRLAMFW